LSVDEHIHQYFVNLIDFSQFYSTKIATISAELTF